MRDSTAQDPPRSPLVVSYALFIATAATLALAFAAPGFRIGAVHVLDGSCSSSEIGVASDIEGRNIFTIRGASILSHLHRLPNILVTSVDISLPDSVTIRCTVPRPVLAWKTRKGIYLVDSYGRLIAQVGTTTLPTVRDTTPLALTLGDYVRESVVVAARYTMHTLPHAGIEWLTLGEKRGLIVHSRRGWTASLGVPAGGNLVFRVATLKRLLFKAAQNGQRVRLVDLTVHPPIVSYS